jgi:hypothetical protein
VFTFFWFFKYVGQICEACASNLLIIIATLQLSDELPYGGSHGSDRLDNPLADMTNNCQQ